MFRFGLLGIPVTVQAWFWVTAALLSPALTSPSPNAVFQLLVWLAVVFFSVIWHELGHALAYRQFGRAPSIVLQAFGGYTAPQRTGRGLTRQQDLAVPAAGPVFGLMLWLVIYGLLKAQVIPSSGVESPWGVMVPDKSIPAFVRWGLQDLQFISLWWSLINLIPVLPLDGGQILASAMGPGKTREVLLISSVAGGLAVLLALARGQMFLALLMGLMVFENYQKLQGGPGGPFPGFPYRRRP